MIRIFAACYLEQRMFKKNTEHVCVFTKITRDEVCRKNLWLQEGFGASELIWRILWTIENDFAVNDGCMLNVLLQTWCFCWSFIDHHNRDGVSLNGSHYQCHSKFHSKIKSYRWIGSGNSTAFLGTDLIKKLSTVDSSIKSSSLMIAPSNFCLSFMRLRSWLIYYTYIDIDILHDT